MGERDSVDGSCSDQCIKYDAARAHNDVQAGQPLPDHFVRNTV